MLLSSGIRCHVRCCLLEYLKITQRLGIYGFRPLTCHLLRGNRRQPDQKQVADTITGRKEEMNTSKLLDDLSGIAEMNRLNGIVPKGQEGQLLISAGLMAVADSIADLTTAFKYSGADTGHLSIGESLDVIADSVKSIEGGGVHE